MCGGDVVCECEARVDHRRVRSGTKLVGGDKVVGPHIVQDPLRDYLFQQLAKTFEEGQQSVALRKGVVSFPGFGDHHYHRHLPGSRVCPHVNA